MAGKEDVRTRWPRRRDILDRDGGEVYLTRWWLLGSSESRWALMLHKMHRPDNDACHHDHPWSFITCVLKGGYFEEITLRKSVSEQEREALEKPLGEKDVTAVIMRFNRPGRILYRKAEHTHRVHSLPNKSCYTLVLRFKKRRHWGFHTSQGWVPWRRFIDLRDGVDWCGDLIRRYIP